MSLFVVPTQEEEPWPTLGPELWAWMLDGLVYGPGDLRGVRLRDYPPDDEFRAQLYRAYEVYPKDHALAGRRRFKRVGLSQRKGTAKSEKAAFIAAAELHHEAPVRCDGWRKVGGVWEPVGRPVSDPYIPMVAYTEEQTEDLAYAALMVVLGEGPLANDFDIGLERITRIRGDGKALPLASSPNARDGARTSFQHFDETHRFILGTLKRTHRTMLANVPKRKLADAWSLETTVAFAPGEASVAESTMDYARKVEAGSVKDPRLFFFHRQASDDIDISTPEGLRVAVIEASGPAAAWSDIPNICSQWDEDDADLPYLERVWLNRLKRQTETAFEVETWKRLARLGYVVARQALIVLGFDGSRTRDGTALVATEVVTGFQWPLGIWQRPPDVERWEVPVDQVDAAVAGAFRAFNVWRLYADPPYWETKVAEWQGLYGEERVVEWWTNRPKPMAYALLGYRGAMAAGDVAHSGSKLFTAHIGNARRRYVTLLDERGERLWVIQKERPDSEHKMDAAMAGCLSWEARSDAIAAGLLTPPEPSVYEKRGIRTVPLFRSNECRTSTPTTVISTGGWRSWLSPAGWFTRPSGLRSPAPGWS